jgi:hypothetical protein
VDAVQCLPSCNVDADCEAINAALRCYGFSDDIGLCAFSTSSWLEQAPERP